MTSATVPGCNRAMLNAWFEIAPDAMLAVDGQGRIVLANPQAERIFGYTRSGLCDLPLEALLPESLCHAHAAHRDLYFKTPQMRPMGTGYELKGRRHDGREFPVEIGLSPVATDGGIVVIASVRDISETRREQQALQRARHDAFVARISQLALETPDYESAISQIPELIAAALHVPAVAILSTDWHRNAFRIRAATGLTATTADALTSIFGSGDLAHHAFAEGDRKPITSGGIAGEASTKIQAGLARTRYQHFALVSLFGRYEPLGILIALARTDDAFDRDKVAFLQAVASMLTATVQRSHAEEQLAHAQRLDAVGQLTGGIAHDFNNLLTVVSGNLQLLEAELSDRPQAQEIIDGALRAVDRGAELTRKLLTFARRQALRPRAIDPEPMLVDLAGMLRRTLGETIGIQIQCAHAVPAVFADPGELETALVNLALNARDAMPRGGQLTIAVREIVIDSSTNEWDRPPGRYVIFDVSDTGVGMTQDVRARASEPFFTTKGAGKGSGLGLSMVYGFVTQSGGCMSIDSRLGYGTHVELLLPAAEGADVSPGSAIADSGRRRKHGTILVVEDEPEVRNVAASFLHEMGYEVLMAGDASEAMQVLAAHPGVDLLFSDVVLGGAMDGMGLANEARRIHPGLAVLLTSGYPGAASGQHGENPAATFRLLHKPYRREQLASAISATLEGG